MNLHPMAVAAIFAALAATPAAAAQAQGPYSGASEESVEAVAALAEAGVKTVAGVVAVPLVVGAAGSYAVGSTAEGIGDSGQAVGKEFSDAADASGEFAFAPLSVTDEVVLKPQPKPQAPYQAAPPAKPK